MQVAAGTFHGRYAASAESSREEGVAETGHGLHGGGADRPCASLRVRAGTSEPARGGGPRVSSAGRRASRPLPELC